MSKANYTFRLEVELREHLERIAKRDKRSVAYVINELLRIAISGTETKKREPQ